jgi:hypothetical protein
MQIPVEKDAKKKAVHTKQMDFTGKEVADESNECYFCGEAVDVTYATISKARLGCVVCPSCTAKVIQVIAYAGTREIS